VAVAAATELPCEEYDDLKEKVVEYRARSRK